ncbi:hypothetical protein RZS08_08555, partial [Arthrospira platensis SPKY1]|nr:hypothetical protein [Arthrospira platensis SPKY1]
DRDRHLAAHEVGEGVINQWGSGDVHGVLIIDTMDQISTPSGAGGLRSVLIGGKDDGHPLRLRTGRNVGRRGLAGRAEGTHEAVEGTQVRFVHVAQGKPGHG